MSIELLAPAGDMERLRMAVAYGADAVYLAGSDFGMRAFAGNFDQKGLREAVELCHSWGVRVHVTCNTMPRCDEVDRLPEWLEFLEDAGADALTLSNTFRAMTIDIQKRRPYLGNLSGGMSGPAVKPMNMFLVWQAYETVHIPIIACGGIASWRDAVEYLLAGASAVQVGSCNFNDPMAMHNIIHDLDSYLHRNGIASVRELCGAAHKQ